MRKTIVTCDRCGVQGGDHQSNKVEAVEIALFVDGEPVPKPIRRDLCPQCIERIRETASETLPTCGA